MWPALSRVQQLELCTFRGNVREEITRVAKAELPVTPTVTSVINAYERWVRVPPTCAFNAEKACMFVAVENLLRLSDCPNEFPSLHINRACTQKTGLYSFRHLLEVLMQFAASPHAWPSGADMRWMRDFRYFRVVSGLRAVDVIERLHAQHVPFCFTHNGHAFCASSADYLSDEGKADASRVYSFNGGDGGGKTSCTSCHRMSTLIKAFQADPTCDVPYVAPLEPRLHIPGTYMWNEEGKLYDYIENS